MYFEYKVSFYTKDSGDRPLFHCHLGIQWADLGGVLEKKGFEPLHPNNYYLDYVKAKCSIEEVLSFTQDGYREDVEAVINYGRAYGVEYEKISIYAEEIETAGGIPPIMIFAHDWGLTYEKTDSKFLVNIWGGKMSDPESKSHDYKISAYYFKRAFNALTMEGAVELFRMNREIIWTVEDVERLFGLHEDGKYDNNTHTDDTLNDNCSPLQIVIDNLEEECDYLATPIINRLARRVIRKIRKQLANYDLSDDLAEAGMNIIDQMSIFYQTRTYSEFSFGFEDYLYDMIQYEIDYMSTTDRLILEHRDLSLLFEGNMEKTIYNDVMSEFSRLIDEHYYCVKIQRFIERSGWSG